MKPLSLPDTQDLLAEAEGIEATYGPNAYSDYLRRNKRRPSRPEAATIGQLLGGRVRADDGTMQPPVSKAERKARKARQDEFARALEAAPWRPWLTVANDNRAACT